MELELVVGEEVHRVEVPEYLLREAAELFEKLDRDMARGWQMSRRWEPAPNTRQRCQIVADRMLTAIYQQRHQFVGVACAYIAKNMPGVRRVYIDTAGDMTQTEFE